MGSTLLRRQIRQLPADVALQVLPRLRPAKTVIELAQKFLQFSTHVSDLFDIHVASPYNHYGYKEFATKQPSFLEPKSRCSIKHPNSYLGFVEGFNQKYLPHQWEMLNPNKRDRHTSVISKGFLQEPGLLAAMQVIEPVLHPCEFAGTSDFDTGFQSESLSVTAQESLPTFLGLGQIHSIGFSETPLDLGDTFNVRYAPAEGREFLRPMAAKEERHE